LRVSTDGATARFERSDIGAEPLQFRRPKTGIRMGRLRHSSGGGRPNDGTWSRVRRKNET